MCLEQEFVDENGTGVPVVSGNVIRWIYVLRWCDYMRVSVLMLSVLTLYFIGRIGITSWTKEFTNLVDRSDSHNHSPDWQAQAQAQ